MLRVAQSPGISAARVEVLFDKMHRAARLDLNIPHNLACVYVARGEYDKAKRCVGDAVRWGYRGAARMRVDRDLDAIREDEDFLTLFDARGDAGTPKRRTRKR